MKRYLMAVRFLDCSQKYGHRLKASCATPRTNLCRPCYIVENLPLYSHLCKSVTYLSLVCLYRLGNHGIDCVFAVIVNINCFSTAHQIFSVAEAG